MFEGYQLASLTARTSDLGGSRGAGGAMAGTFRAQVLEVQPGKAVLSIDGRTITAETNAQLTPNSEYDVVVKGFDGNKVQLQIVTGPPSSGGDAAEQPGVRTLTDADISSRLLGFDLPDHPAEVISARALMNAGIPVTKENMQTLLHAAPPQATAREIDFLVSIMKSGGEPTRDSLRLMPLIDSQLRALPENMSSIFDLAAKDPVAFAKFMEPSEPAQAAGADRLALRNVEVLLIKPETDTLSAAADKLQAIGKQFFTASEARLAFLGSFKAAVAAGAEETETIVQKLANLLQLLPSEPSEKPNALLDQVIRNTLNLIRNLPIAPVPAETQAAPTAAQPAEAQPSDTQAETGAAAQPAPTGASPSDINAVRDGLVKTIQQQLQQGTPAQKYDLIRETITSALAKIIENLRNLQPGKMEGLLPEKFLQMPQRLQNLVGILQEAAQQQQQPNRTALIPSPALIARLTEEISSLLTMKFNPEAAPEAQKLIDAIAQLIQHQAQQPDAHPETTQAERFQQLIKQAASAPLQQEIQQLASQLRDAADLRAAMNMLAQNVSTPHDSASAAMNLARNLQLATFSNLVAHNGAAPTEAFVTFFPIQVGDRVEIGKLKVFRNTDPDSRKSGKKVKEIDPDNATLVILLDTQFIGLSTVRINTHRRQLNCAIEVENKRVKKILDKFIGELAKALEKTPFDINNVSVNVVKPRAAAAKAAGEGKQPSPKITTIDMKI